jgi:hypothetical protein
MSIEVEIYKNKVFYFKNAIPNYDKIIKYIESTSNNIITDWLPWGNQYAFSLEQKKYWEELGITPEDFGLAKSIHDPNLFDTDKKDAESHWVFESINKAIIECSDKYAEHLGIDTNLNPRIPSPGYVIGRYSSLQSRGLHTDCPYDDLEHSFVIYYNDDYDEGYLNFPNYDFKIKPKAGSIVMFKSSDLDNEHEAVPNIGVKYITPHFWRMGPSQGFVPWGLKNVEVPENITNDFYNLEAVEKRKAEIFGE